MSNAQIFSLIGSSKNVIQVRRFVRREKGDNGVAYKSTQAAAVPFAATNLPRYAHLDSKDKSFSSCK